MRIPECGRLPVRLMRASQGIAGQTARPFFYRLAWEELFRDAWIPRSWKYRSSRISRFFLLSILRVHRGYRWRRLCAYRWHLGHTWADFTRCVLPASFKKKALAKKQRKRKHSAAPKLKLQVQRLRDFQLGVRRRTVLSLKESVRDVRELDNLGEALSV